MEKKEIVPPQGWEIEKIKGDEIFLKEKRMPVDLSKDEEQAFYLNKLKLKRNIHIAWDLPQIDLTEGLKSMIKYIKPYKITCYVLVGFNSTIEQDLYRLEILKSLGITPFVQPYRDFENKRNPTQYELDLARWANKMWLFKAMSFKEYSPRKGFKCSEYFK